LLGVAWHLRHPLLVTTAVSVLSGCMQSVRDGTSGLLGEGPPTSDAGTGSESASSYDGYASSIGADVEDCAGTDDPNVVLVRQPEFLSVFQFVGVTECASLDRSSLFRNVGTEPVRILGFGFDRSEFLMPALPLPSFLQPGEALSVPIRFRGNEAVSTALTVATDHGCRQFEVLGVPGTEALFDLSAAALDFGRVPVGGVSEPRKLTFQTQLADTVDARKRGLDEIYFAVSPSDLFEVVEGPTSPLRMRSCIPVEIQIRFIAPQSAGPVSGQLGYAVGPGDGLIELFGEAFPR
jgi:hypothetical protein